MKKLFGGIAGETSRGISEEIFSKLSTEISIGIFDKGTVAIL